MYKDALVQTAAENGITIRRPYRNHAMVSYGRGYPIKLEVNFWSVSEYNAIGITLMLIGENMTPENQARLADFEQAYQRRYPGDLVLPDAQRSTNRRKLVVRKIVDFDPILMLDQDFREGLEWHINRLNYTIGFLREG